MSTSGEIVVQYNKQENVTRSNSSNGRHYGVIFFKPEKNLEFFRLKNDPIDGYPGKLE